MQIVCPSCQAVYEVPQAMLMGAPRVQCARCDQEWTVDELPPDPLYSAPAGPTRPAAMSDGDFAGSSAAESFREPLAQASEPPPLNFVPSIALVASLLLLIGLGWAGFHWRDHVMLAWPASARLFAALGLGPAAM